MTRAPLILITACTDQNGTEFEDVSLSLSSCYVQAIKAAGGLCWIMPTTGDPVEIAECVRRCDGIMLTGGNDMQPGRKDELVHDVTLTPDSLIAKIFRQEQIRVNSSHHQAVAEIAKAFRATARSNDGVVEALEMSPEEKNLLPYLLSVQFHPERLFGQYPEFLEIFRSFIRGCRIRL